VGHDHFKHLFHYLHVGGYPVGRLLAAFTLMVLVMMTEIERALWSLGKEDPDVR
jgi:hypothetical protein